MSVSPQLSVLLTTHTDPGQIELFLETLLDFRLSNLEVILVSDSGDREVNESFRQLLDQHPGQRTKCIELERPLGRAYALNRALESASGELVWAPLKASRMNKIVLTDCLRKASADPVGFWLLDGHLPEDLPGWARGLAEGGVPSDERFLFHRKSLTSENLTFRSGLNELTAAEVAYQLWRLKGYETLDAFFIADRVNQPVPAPQVRQEFLFSMVRTASDQEERELLLRHLSDIDLHQKNEPDPDTLERARETVDQDPRLALEMVNAYLKQNPDDEEGVKMKVVLLEKLRRHVEAAELKHDLQKRHRLSPVQQQKPAQPTLFSQIDDGTSDEVTEPRPPAGPPEVEADDGIELSLIVPTTGNGKQRLEPFLVHLERVCGDLSVELIVIDNASIDDTFDYLNQLEKDGFLNLQVLTNRRNAGFARSANQGIEKAKGSFLAILHNDLFPEPGTFEEMIALLNEYSEIGVVGPRTDRSRQPEQAPDRIPGNGERFSPTEAIDSCCMMLRAKSGFRFDEIYGLAWYEDLDLCEQIRNKGKTVAIANHTLAHHRPEATTVDMGLMLEPERQWENADLFCTKWGREPELTLPEGLDFPEILKEIPIPVNPLNPPGYWLDQIDSLFSDELKTRIQKQSLAGDDLLRLIRVLIIADKREFLRQMESRAVEGNIELPKALLEELVRFYYYRNIYSRCRLYLSKPNANGPLFDLYKLRIAVKEKEVETAIELLTELMDQFPCHPNLYRIAAEIHLLGENMEEAESFHQLANQLEPDYDPDEEIFEIKY